MNPSFSVRVQVHPRTGQPMAAYFHICDGKAAEVREVVKDTVFANYGRRGQLLGVELLAPCKKILLTKLAADAPQAIRQAVKRLLIECAPASLLAS